MLSAPVDVVLGALDMARAGRFAEICELFAPPLRPLITPEGLAAGWNAELARQGQVTSVGAPLTEPTGTGVVVRVAVSCEHGGFAVVAPVTEQGQLAGLQLAPPGRQSRSPRGRRRRMPILGTSTRARSGWGPTSSRSTEP